MPVRLTQIARDYDFYARQIGRETAAAQRDQMGAGLLSLMQVMLQQALRGDTRAGDVYVRANESWRRLYGADAPLKIASTTPDGERWAPVNVDITQLSREELTIAHRLLLMRAIPNLVMRERITMDVDAVDEKDSTPDAAGCEEASGESLNQKAHVR